MKDYYTFNEAKEYFGDDSRIIIFEDEGYLWWFDENSGGCVMVSQNEFDINVHEVWK